MSFKYTWFERNAVDNHMATNANAQMMPITHKSVITMAVPIMLSNVSQPLLGVVDTAVIGQLPQAHYIGAVAIGALIFSLVYWGFGFLRMGTSGIAAQAYGAGDGKELAAVLYRALLLAAGIGVILLVLAPLISRLSFWLVAASPEIEREARIYFDIRIWSAPFSLTNYAIMGWLIGIGQMRWAFAVQIYLNVANMALDALFVLYLGMATAGIGYGTLIAEVSSAFVGFAVVWMFVRRDGEPPSRARVLDRARIKRMVLVNSDIMVRTFCLTFGFAWFAAQGAKISDVAVSANAILMQLFFMGSNMIDGFATVSEALVGQSVGARSRQRYMTAVRISSQWAMVSGALLSLGVLLAGPWSFDLMSANPDIRSYARSFLWWAALTPILGAACFQLDGIFIGATRTRDMRNMMIISLIVYLAAGYGLTPVFGNHGLWFAMCLFFIVRGVTLFVRMPALARDVFA
jgi:MATE family multidrug resistance protein